LSAEELGEGFEPLAVPELSFFEHVLQLSDAFATLLGYLFKGFLAPSSFYARGVYDGIIRVSLALNGKVYVLYARARTRVNGSNGSEEVNPFRFYFVASHPSTSLK